MSGHLWTVRVLHWNSFAPTVLRLGWVAAVTALAARWQNPTSKKSRRQARGEISLQELDERLGRFELMNVRAGAGVGGYCL